MSDVSVAGVDPDVQRLIKARKSPAVLKAKLVAFMSSRPDSLVFAFEGGDDKIVYYQWIRRIRPGMSYEPFPCDGKEEVKNLKNIAAQDLNQIEKNLFYFVDRDFDDLEGFLNATHVFMTSSYSVENYLVSPVVVEETLKNEFPCHGEPSIREGVTAQFRADYEKFLLLARDVNFRLFVARRASIRLSNRIPEKLSAIAVVQGVGDIQGPETEPQEVIRFSTEPSDDVVDSLRAEFEQLNPHERYRGKFCYKFFLTWLLKLSEELQFRTTNLFDGLGPGVKARTSELVLSSFAAKSLIPEGLPEFLELIS